MSVTVRVPTPLRPLTQGKDEVSIEAGSVKQVIDRLEVAYPGIRDRICDDKGVRRFVNLFANDEDIRFLQNLETVLADGDSLSIVPAIAGGC